MLAASGCRDGQAREDERAAIEVVEHFLSAAGQFDLDALPRFFVPNANIKATSPRDGQSQSHNIDYFTLMRHDGTWKILSGSYVALPIGSR